MVEYGVQGLPYGGDEAKRQGKPWTPEEEYRLMTTRGFDAAAAGGVNGDVGAGEGECQGGFDDGEFGAFALLAQAFGVAM